MAELRNIGISLIVFAALISLVVGINQGVQSLYSFEDNHTIEGKNVGQTLNDLSLIKQMNRTLTEPSDLKIPTGSFLDVVGSLAAAGIGALKTIASIIALPVEIFGIITNFYPVIPNVFINALITIIVLIVGFVIISKYIGSEI